MLANFNVTPVPEIQVGDLFFYEQYGVPASLCVKAQRLYDDGTKSDYLVFLPTGRSPEWEGALHSVENFRGSGAVVNDCRLIIDPSSMSSSASHGSAPTASYIIVADDQSWLPVKNGRWIAGYVNLESGLVESETPRHSACFLNWRIERGDPAEMIYENTIVGNERNG